MKIITLTVNPAIDKSTSVKAIIPDAKLRCKSPVYEPGGGGLNVSRALANLDTNSLAVYFNGGWTGHTMESLLSEEKFDKKIIEIKNSTRVNFIVVDGHGQQFRFGMPGEPVSEQEWQSCLNFFENLSDIPEYIVVSGSLSPGIPDDFYAQLSRIAKKKGAKVILDCSGPALEKALEEGVFLIKPNLSELAKLTGHDEIEESQQESMALELINAGKVEMVVVSMGPHGAMLASKNGILYATPPPVKMVSTVGAGDSMVAGLTYGLMNHFSDEEIIKHAVACGTASTINPGTELCKKSDVNKIIKRIHIRKA